MIVMFKAGRSPSTTGRAGPFPAVEFGLRNLIWWITIIEYNLKAAKGRPRTFSA
jgi:hypothetical protein